MHKFHFNQLFLPFLRLGSLGFGGPLALIALMEQEFVTQKKWVSDKAFQQALVLCKMLPGPTSFQMALWIGNSLKGKLGGILAGFSFILPTALLLGLFAKHYDQLMAFSHSDSILSGIRVGVLVIICQTLVSLSKPFLKDVSAWCVVIPSCFLAIVFPGLEPLIIFTGGILGAVLLSVFWVHFKGGAFVFGPGLTILSTLQYEVVQKFQWLSQKEFLDAFALSQAIPGPVTTLSSFIGYQIAGWPGSLVALFGMYLPGVVFVLFCLPRIAQILEEKLWIKTFYQTAFFSVVGCLGASAVPITLSTLMRREQVVSFALLLVIQVFQKTPVWMTLVLGAVMAWLSN
ncbi:hypothetical protein EBR78_06270 [bacterium]|nr:hypothetical protein [bacterium]